jgi:hypothetical protein
MPTSRAYELVLVISCGLADQAKTPGTLFLSNTVIFRQALLDALVWFGHSSRYSLPSRLKKKFNISLC